MKTAVPHLHLDRHGTYYFRVTDAGKTIKRSLRTKNVELATMRAACLNYEWDAMNRSAEPTIAEIQQARLIAANLFLFLASHVTGV